MPSPTPERARRVLSDAATVLFDLDGTLCHLFGAYPLGGILAELHEVERSVGIDLGEYRDPYKAMVRASQDPHASEAQRRELVSQFHRRLAAVEVRAVGTAPAVAGAVELVDSLLNRAVPVGVVTTNSAECAEAFLALHGLDGRGVVVSGRSDDAPTVLKPDPRPVLRALNSLGASPSGAVLVGDSPDDAGAASTAGTAFIGVAGNRAKAERLSPWCPPAPLVRDLTALSPR